MGGMIGMRLALKHPELLRSLTLIDTTSRAEDSFKVEIYNVTRQMVADGEFDRVAEVLPQSFFCDEFIRDRPDQVRAWIDSLRNGDLGGFMRAFRGVDDRDDVTDRLGEINLPALVIHGSEDAAIELFKGEELAARIPGARFEVIEGAGHQSNVDHPQDVARLVKDFLSSVRSGATAGAS
jgi:pimeloyl-ACP methyl ester carboxylesterase